MPKLPPYVHVRKSNKDYYVDLQVEVNGVMKTIHTVCCKSEDEQARQIKGLGDWGAQIAESTRLDT